MVISSVPLVEAHLLPSESRLCAARRMCRTSTFPLACSHSFRQRPLASAGACTTAIASWVAYPLASRGRRTVSTTTHQNLQEACMHYCDGIKFVTRIRTAARARNLVLRVLGFRLEWRTVAIRTSTQRSCFVCTQPEIVRICRCELWVKYRPPPRGNP